MVRFNGQAADYCENCRVITPLDDLWRNEATGYKVCSDCIKYRASRGKQLQPPTKAMRNMAHGVK